MLARPHPIPTYPGVYVFWLKRTPLYVGKAANLKKRLASYFQNRERLPMKIQRMLQEATRVETIKTASEIEALLKEAELIKKYRPKYNLLMRDDKSYFYVAITREEFPRIFITHQPRGKSTNGESITNIRIRIFAKDSLFVDERRRLETRTPKCIGPFTSGTALKAVLKLLRRVFPYCTCKRPHKRPCLNSEIGKCPGYCCVIQNLKFKIQNYRREYQKNIRSIVTVLTGRRTWLLASLKKQMKEAAKAEGYEKAARLRDQIFGLESIFAHRPVLRLPEIPETRPTMQSKLQSLLKTEKIIRRIEGYDISNISGQEATGSMVVFTDGQPDKNQYRKFRIKTVKGISDVDMLEEVLFRRLRHAEWPYPDLIVIDGGRGQLNAALQVLQGLGKRRHQLSPIPYSLFPPLVTALAKREEILYTQDSRTIALKKQDPAILHLFQRIRDESHRFARAYHHKLRKRHFAEWH